MAHEGVERGVELGCSDVGAVVAKAAIERERTEAGRFVEVEIAALERLEFLNGFSNPQGEFAASPFPGDWPRQMRTVITFEDLGDETEISPTSEPYNATEAQQATFAATMPSMVGGWAGTFARLDDHLNSQAN